ncbi:MAG TPA: toll/interleukin-1 receptor domain-containing protein [Actinophytocola sp.]|uniref:toll/interleukin-1 receptor domain-containing protein n=1 Tax=Actinophytocola sp. TaxID=1872138 RepID=UPI002DBE146D|nr:toll/interleukin-1 receptor domain-containing protein [Actinophytocola sp.]HEU5470189.1 toll/interleukin-1 receptor domain-containing protein [Actinophytocola sp.]
MDVFVSYRSDDNPYVAAQLHTVLGVRFGRHRVFRDCDSMRPGQVYPDSIRAALASCRVLVVVIGPGWLTATAGSGRRRLDDTRDWVRRELKFAFGHKVPVVPVLLDGAAPPAPGELPDDIRQLGLTQAHRVRHRQLRTDLDALVEHLTALVPGLGSSDLAAEPNPTGVHNQHNMAGSGGTVFANQGTQNIYPATEGVPRP